MPWYGSRGSKSVVGQVREGKGVKSGGRPFHLTPPRASDFTWKIATRRTLPPFHITVLKGVLYRLVQGSDATE